MWSIGVAQREERRKKEVTGFENEGPEVVCRVISLNRSVDPAIRPTMEMSIDWEKEYWYARHAPIKTTTEGTTGLEWDGTGLRLDGIRVKTQKRDSGKVEKK
ncbi:hypothetical protein KQX54_008074 [Cotesia glomerata]|uniref:Uncharacterized protein n=1 Tax=Cotesia glomerata TaxID=32391 RepID=A0AAV7J7N9_COTGL|nr:hypothetical protein KQX54_008074 [Cotesia glomerata]